MKYLMVVFISLVSVFVFTPAHAAEPFIMLQGYDWGKVTADRNTAVPRDNECDGNPVYIKVYEEGTLNTRKFFDSNGCDSGGGQFVIPNWANRAVLCEEPNAGFDDCSNPTPRW